MKMNNRRKLLIILSLYLLATFTLLFWGYSVREPVIASREFPFTITYTYRGTTETISEVYVAEYCRTEKYIGDDVTAWYGYVKDWNRLEADYCRVVEDEGRAYSISVNLNPGYLMGDPNFSDFLCEPTAKCLDLSVTDDVGIIDPAELEALGFTIDSFTYPEPIENAFRYGGISLSSEATIYTAILSILALIAVLILIRRERGRKPGVLDRIGAVFNFLVAVGAFPFILIAAALSEIVAEPSPIQQLLYLTPALTVLGIAASAALRRMGHSLVSFLVQFAGPALFALSVWIEGI